jgi:hypothetical protein
MMGAGQLSLISAAKRLPRYQQFDTTPVNLGTLLLLFAVGSAEFPYSLRGWLPCCTRTLRAGQEGQQPAEE